MSTKATGNKKHLTLADRAAIEPVSYTHLINDLGCVIRQ